VHGARVERHDSLVKEIAKLLRQEGWKVDERNKITIGNSFLKPDLIAWRGECIRVLDLSIVADGFHMDLPFWAKVAKYDRPEVKDEARRKANLKGEVDFQVNGVIINWRGAWYPPAYNALKNMLGRNAAKSLETLIVNCLVGSWGIWNMESLRPD
jgi:hypothetical protein